MIDMLVGDVRACLAELEPASVHCVVTSPPYWGLRDYGLEPVTWADGWVGCLGLEPTPEQYVEHLLEVIDVGLRRVLRKDGTLWLNLGDCYATGAGRVGNAPGGGAQGEAWKKGAGTGSFTQPNRMPIPGLKPKDLVRIPARVAAAMQARGWYLRSEIPWVKRNVLPSSVKDRPTTAHETVFLFAHPDSGGRYFYDVEAVKVAGSGRAAGNKRRPAEEKRAKTEATERHVSTFCGDRVSKPYNTRQLRDSDFFFDSLRQLRDDLTTILDGGEGLLHDENGDPVALVVNPRPFKEAHFAVFPPQLVEPMIQAGTSGHGVCRTCGAPWKRVTAKRKAEPSGAAIGGCPDRHDGGTRERALAGSGGGNVLATRTVDTGLWTPTCSCPGAAPIPATVLDPFSGAGTTSMVAEALGRDSIYIDQSDEFADIAERRWNAAAKKG